MTGDEVGNVVTGETMGEIEDLTRGPRYFKNIDEVLPNFDPVKEDISVNQWIDKIEEYAEIYDWDDLAIRHFGLSKLCGVARAWRDSLPRQERKWQDWCRLLRENFPCQENRMAITLMPKIISVRVANISWNTSTKNLLGATRQPCQSRKLSNG
jgi:hypothetical protein